MPLTEMPSDISGSLQAFGDRDLLRTQRTPPGETPEAVRVPPGHHAPARRRTDRGGRIEMVKSQPLGGHGVQVRRLQQGCPL